MIEDPSPQPNRDQEEAQLPRQRLFDGIAEVDSEEELGTLFRDPSLSATYVQREPSPYSDIVKYLKPGPNGLPAPRIAFMHYDVGEEHHDPHFQKCANYEEFLSKNIEESPSVPEKYLNALYEDLMNAARLAKELFGTDRLRFVSRVLSVGYCRFGANPVDPSSYSQPHTDQGLAANLIWTPSSEYDMGTGIFPNDNIRSEMLPTFNSLPDPYAGIKKPDDRLDLAANWMGLILGGVIPDGRTPAVHRGVPLEGELIRYFHSISTLDRIPMVSPDK